MTQARLLVVDEEPATAAQVQTLLDRMEGMAFEVAHCAGDALRCATEAHQRGESFAVMLVDHHTSGMAAADLVAALRERGVTARVLFMSGREPLDVAPEAVPLGSFDFITKPLNRAELEMRVELALRDRRIAEANKHRTRKVRRPRKSEVIIGRSPSIKKLYERMSMVAPTDVTVAISGESGTGKELVARTIHNVSNRYQGPFVVVNCAAIPESLLENELFGHVKGAFTDATRDRDGLFAAAHTGTLFLDEIGELPLSLQAKVLRVLQSGEFRRIGDNRPCQVDVRIITATNRDLEKAVREARFREDLYYRINVFPVVLAPLRERRQDIPLLAHHFLVSHRRKIRESVEGFSPAALARLQDYDFPGNVRELENIVHHALVLAQGPIILPEGIPIGKRSESSEAHFDMTRTFSELKREVVGSFEESYVRELLRMCRGNVAAASRQAGMDRKNLWSLARKYAVDPNDYRPADQRQK